MNLKSIAAVAAFAVAAVSAQAASVGDLIVGFTVKNTAGTGYGTSVQFDIGTYANLTTAYSLVSGSSTTYSLGNVSSYLSAFGSSTTWSSNSYLVWGVAGETQDIDANPIIWLSNKRTGTSTDLTKADSTAFASKSSGAIGTASSKIANLYNATYTGTQSVSTLASSGTYAWAKNDPFNYTTAQLDTPITSATDLYNIVSDGSTGSGVYAGTFAVSSTGDLTFTVIPEPSTYALILGAMTVGFVSLRRRFSRAV